LGDVVNVNKASPWQLAVLLELTRDEVESLLLARPVASKEALRSAMPRRVAADVSLDLPKLDINSASDEDLVKTTGIPRVIALRIVEGRPFYFISQLRSLIGEDIYQQVEPLYTVPSLAYRDKLTGRVVKLSADSSHVLISRSERESVNTTIKRWNLEHMYPQAIGSVYDVFSIPETEAVSDLLLELQRSYGRNLIPGYRDERSNRRYFNPKFCVVQFVPEVAEARQEEIITGLRLQIEARHQTIGLYTLRIPEAQANPIALMRIVQALNNLPEVSFSEPNYIGFDDLDRIAPPRPFRLQAEAERLATLPWNLSLVNAPQAWSQTRGSSDIVIAVIDSGVDMKHPSLQGSFVTRSPGENWNFAFNDDLEPRDEDGHGTFICGLLVGNGTQGVHGISPECRVLPLKVPLSGEVTSYARRRDAILYALEKVPRGKQLIMNLSWKTSGDVALIRDAINQAAARGAIVVASAGNLPSRENEPHYPSDYPAVISVAAVGPDRARAYYSFYGDQVDISAPGGDDYVPDGDIFSAAPNVMVTTGVGTSFAAPHVAGSAALLASANRSLTPERIRSAIESSAGVLPERGLGRGLVDVRAALDIAASSHPTTDVLTVINFADLPTLITRFGLLQFTAQLIIARRPHARVEQIRGTLGLTAQQYAAIVGAQPGSGDGVLRLINSATQSSLVSRFGLLPFTAQVLIARRPFTSVEQIRRISGLSSEQYAAISGASM
jgi:subtilisin family serine protease/DNA uptake protein ComE-like DNA-binding protein